MKNRKSTTTWLLLLVIGLPTLIVFVFLSNNWTFDNFKNQMTEFQMSLSTLSDSEQQFSESNSQKDLEQLAKMESHNLTNYSWVDRQAGLVRIPIERAIQILQTTGLPDLREKVVPVPQTTTVTQVTPTPQKIAATGEKLFLQYGCNNCHLPDDQSRAPSLNGLFGRNVHLESSETLLADESYIRESILNPQTQVVKGFSPIMPPYQSRLSKKEVLQIVAYIKSLKK